MLKLTTDKHEALRGLSATAELLVCICQKYLLRQIHDNFPTLQYQAKLSEQSDRLLYVAYHKKWKVLCSLVSCPASNITLALFLAERLRLAGSGRPREGRLEVYYNGRWGTVCDNYFDNLDASVACFQLGLG